MSLKISQLVQHTPVGNEFFEVIISPYSPGTNRKVLLSDIQGDPLDQVSVDVSGGTITLDINDLVQRMFEGNASFGTPKTIALDGDTNALVINFKFNLSNVAAVLTFPTAFRMQTVDLRWSPAGNTFTPTATGLHEGSATWSTIDSAWDLKMTHPFT